MLRHEERVGGEYGVKALRVLRRVAELCPRAVPQPEERGPILREVCADQGAPPQPLTAPMVTPSRKYFCSEKNRMNIGSDDTTAPAIMGEKRVPFANLKVLRPT